MIPGLRETVEAARDVGMIAGERDEARRQLAERSAQLEPLLERIAVALEELVSIEARRSAVDSWRNGVGKHPDD